MPQDDAIIQAITREVLAVLAARGMAATPSGTAAPISKPASSAAPAEVHPPIGICTGDYSKFPELAGKLYGVSANMPASSAVSTPTNIEAAASTPAVIPLTGIVTANQLQQAIDAASDGVALLAHDARLSPLANDLARKLANRVRRVAPGAASPGGSAPLPWLWWIQGSCPVVASVTTQRAAGLRLIAAGPTPNALGRAVRELAAAVRSKRASGGFLFVPSAARAACFANRCSSLRAAVATCGEAVEQAIAELGANTLIIEYPHHGYRAVSAFVDRFLQQPPAAPPQIERDLADLDRC